MAVSSRVAVALGTLAILGSVAWGLTRDASKELALSGARPASFVTDLRAGQRICQGIADLEDERPKVILTLGTYSKGPQPLEFTVGGSKTTLRRYGQGVIPVRLSRIMGVPAGEICIKNRGRWPVAIAGEGSLLIDGAILDGHRRPFRLAIDRLESHPGRWGARVSAVLTRVGEASGGGASAWRGTLSLVFAAFGLLGALLAVRWTVGRRP